MSTFLPWLGRFFVVAVLLGGAGIYYWHSLKSSAAREICQSIQKGDSVMRIRDLASRNGLRVEFKTEGELKIATYKMKWNGIQESHCQIFLDHHRAVTYQLWVEK